MKPLYWKILLILGAVIVAASLIIPKTLRKNVRLEPEDTSRSERVVNAGRINIKPNVIKTDFGQTPHTQIVLEVDKKLFVRQMLRSEFGRLRLIFRENNMNARIRIKDGAFIVAFHSDELNELGKPLLDKFPDQIENGQSLSATVEQTANRTYRLEFTKAYIEYRMFKAARQARDSFAVHINPDNVAFFDTKVLANAHVRLRVAEGVDDDTFRKLLRKTRNVDRLSFHEVVDASADSLDNCLQNRRCRIGTDVYPQKYGGGHMMVRSKKVISNSDIKAAKAGLHPGINNPVVNFTFNSRGAIIFCDFTSNHVGELFAVVLNDEIITAPRINGAICGGSGFIEGGFTMESAENLALSLNAGTLPTYMRVVEERTVVPNGTAAPQK